MRVLTIVSLFAFALFSCGARHEVKKKEKNCFPVQPVAKIEILVADTSILAKEFIPENDTVKTYPVFDGVGFVKLDGSPVHQPLKRIVLSESQQKEFLTILRPLPPQNEGDVTSCFPVFRHVVLFYDKEEKLIGQMHICLGCGQVRFKPEPACLDFFENHRLSELKKFFKSVDIPMFDENL